MPNASKFTVNYFCLGALFVFVGSVLLCTLGFTVVLPFEAMRSWPQVVCTVINSSYDLDVCSCDEQISVFDTCVSQFPCLKVYVSYVVTTSTTSQPRPTTSLQNTSSLPTSVDHQHSRRRRRSTATASLHAPVVNDSATSSPSDVRQLGLVDQEQQYGGVENQLSTLNISRDGEHVPLALVSNTSSATSQIDAGSLPSTRPNLDHLSVNESESMTSYGIANDQATADYDFRHLTPTTTDDKPYLSFVAQLFRSWDDSFQTECSLSECDDDVWNIRQARLFKSKWGQVGQTFNCFYNPDRQDVVILERTTKFAAVNAVVWPCLLLLVGVSLWLGLCLGCWSLGNDAPYKEEYGGTSLRLN